MKRKLKSSRGLSLVETLCAVLILILLGLMVNTGPKSPPMCQH